MESEYSHSRYNPLLDKWTLVSPHRVNRPWSGEGSKSDEKVESMDNSLMPGAFRYSGIKNLDYKDVFVFNNDFPAFNVTEVVSSVVSQSNDDLLKVRLESGECKVMCYHPDRKMTIPNMSDEQVEKIVRTWITVYLEMKKTGRFDWIQIFENRGSLMGCSNPHPHCQIWATRNLPCEIDRKDKTQSAYLQLLDFPFISEISSENFFFVTFFEMRLS
ncbi:hypothetical protein ACOME3_004744 [Neoechinorhynchus agilis]